MASNALLSIPQFPKGYSRWKQSSRLGIAYDDLVAMPSFVEYCKRYQALRLLLLICLQHLHKLQVTLGQTKVVVLLHSCALTLHLKLCVSLFAKMTRQERVVGYSQQRYHRATTAQIIALEN